MTLVGQEEVISTLGPKYALSQSFNKLNEKIIIIIINLKNKNKKI